MAKEKERSVQGNDSNNNNNHQKQKQKQKLLVKVVWKSYAAELKLLLTALLILCSVATLLQFLPSRFSLSTSDLRFCISRITTADTLAAAASNQTLTPTPAAAEPEIPQTGPSLRRTFRPYGAAAYSFVTMGAYRGGPNTFAVVGLASKPLHVYARPTYECVWAPRNASLGNISAVGYKILPDWGYGRVYTAVVVNCTFPDRISVNTDNSGGELLLLASTSGGGDTDSNATDTIPALSEAPGSVDFSLFTSQPKYEYLYCGSSLYGNLSPQRVREWVAYHVRLFGARSHFVIHDAGGVHEEVMEVLRPWIELGYVTLQDIREQERFDGYYHNQFVVVNDCLHRYKFAAKWMFFFDVDEFIYVPPKSTIKSVLASLSEYSQFTIEQMPMSGKLCYSDNNPGRTYRKWGFEKLVYRDTKTGIRRDRKYAVQPRNLYATGVHMSQNLVGTTTHKTEGRIMYFHYHGTIAQRREPCRYLLNSTETTFEKYHYAVDNTMSVIAGSVKKFELKMIGTTLHKTRQ